MTPGTLILSSLFHGTLLAGAVYASVPPVEFGKPAELVSWEGLDRSGSPPPSESSSGSPAAAPAFVPPRLLETAVIDGEVTAEFVVLPNGRVDPATLEIVSASHDGLEAATRSLLGQLRFAPARFHGEPVASLTRVPIVIRVGGG